MTAKDFTDRLMELIESNRDFAPTLNHKIRRVRTYEEVGVLTRDAGVVVELNDGSEFQITVVRSRRPRS
jgi:hypothetical protein